MKTLAKLITNCYYLMYYCWLYITTNPYGLIKEITPSNIKELLFLSMTKYYIRNTNYKHIDSNSIISLLTLLRSTFDKLYIDINTKRRHINSNELILLYNEVNMQLPTLYLNLLMDNKQTDETIFNNFNNLLNPNNRVLPLLKAAGCNKLILNKINEILEYTILLVTLIPRCNDINPIQRALYTMKILTIIMSYIKLFKSIKLRDYQKLEIIGTHHVYSSRRN